jgi:hypothetical protein
MKARLPRKFKVKKPQLPKQLLSGFTEETPADQTVPRITNESVAEHREEVLGRARKLIYPLRHSRAKFIRLSIAIFVVAVVLFLSFCSLALYKFQSTSTFMYGVVRVIPFPVARADGRFVSYDSYLFELRHYMHYYQTQQDVDFSSASGKRQLASLKQRSLDEVMSRAYVARLASEHHVTVSSQEINDQVTLAREQNRLGASDTVFKSVLNEFWGWSVADFKHELKLEILDQKVAATLDTSTTARAKAAYAQLQAGADFAQVASTQSDDIASRASGGSYGFDISPTNRDLPPLIIQALFSLQPGQYSGIINNGYSLDIVKVLSATNGKLQAAHITFTYKDISTYTAPLRQASPPHLYLHIPTK